MYPKINIKYNTKITNLLKNNKLRTMLLKETNNKFRIEHLFSRNEKLTLSLIVGTYTNW